MNDIEFLIESSTTFCLIAKKQGPDKFRVLLTALMTNVAGKLPDDYWQEFSKAKPCSTDGCVCHVSMQVFLDALSELRRYHMVNTAHVRMKEVGKGVPKSEATKEEFIAERNEALLSLDEEKIRAMVLKWNGEKMPDNKQVFWAAVHKAITAASGLPIEFRRKSKEYLISIGSMSEDDGDL